MATIAQAEGLRLLRVVARLSQDEIARRAGVSRGYLSRVERGYSVPPPEVLERIVQALGLPAEPEADPPEAQP